MKSIKLSFGISQTQSVNLRTWGADFNDEQKDFSEILDFVKERHENITGKQIEPQIYKITEQLYRIGYGSELYAYFITIQE